jgi:hypothetical protein
MKLTTARQRQPKQEMRMLQQGDGISIRHIASQNPLSLALDTIDNRVCGASK